MNGAIIAMTTKTTQKEKAKTEKEIKAEIKDYLSRFGHFEVIHRTGYGNAGVSDLIGCIKGVFVAVEVKRQGRKPTSNQQKYIDNINRNGGIAFVATSVADVIAEMTNRALWRDEL
jgi:hypothetical protein